MIRLPKAQAAATGRISPRRRPFSLHTEEARAVWRRGIPKKGKEPASHDLERKRDEMGVENGRKRIRCALKFVMVFLLLILLFVCSMTAVYLIPEERIAWHREYSMLVLENIEETWESFGNVFGLHSEPGMMDISTDLTMLEETVALDQSLSPLQAAMSINGYARYWHGYQVFLRPLLAVYQIHQIRYLNMFLFFGVFCILLPALVRRVGRAGTAAFVLSMVCAHIVVIPVSMQYMAVFMVTMIAMLCILARYPFRKPENLPLFFMVIGMVVNFLDFLTAPIVTLGVPLLLCLHLEREREANGPGALKMAVGCSAAWALGYALCWAAKWVIASVVLHRNELTSALGHAEYWTMSDAFVPSRMSAVLRNFQFYFKAQGMRSLVFPLLLLAVLAVLALCFRRRGWQHLACSAVMLAVSLYPYAWYFVMKEHSWVHAWFTYRGQVVTLFGVCLALSGLIDRGRCRKAMRALRERAGKKPA